MLRRHQAHDRNIVKRRPSVIAGGITQPSAFRGYKKIRTARCSASSLLPRTATT
jgi:hypothetical protein